MTEDRLKSPRARMFVALDLPEEFLDGFVAWQEQAFGARRDLRLIPRFSLHVTLVFLGYQFERDIERIAETSFSERPEPFELRALEVVEVPPRRPRLYAVGLEDSGDALVGWQAGLSARLEAAGLYEPEKRPFWPHLTVGRFKKTERHQGGVRPRTGARARGPIDQPEPLPELPDDLQQAFPAGRLTLYRSTLKPQGAVYDALSRVELASV
jgi:2'-5' RNA ligase